MEDQEDPRVRFEQEWLKKHFADDRLRYRIMLDQLRTGDPKQWRETALAMLRRGTYNRVEQIKQMAEGILERRRFVLMLYEKYVQAIAEKRMLTIEEYFVEYGQELDDALNGLPPPIRPAREVVEDFLREFGNGNRKDPNGH